MSKCVLVIGVTNAIGVRGCSGSGFLFSGDCGVVARGVLCKLRRRVEFN